MPNNIKDIIRWLLILPVSFFSSLLSIFVIIALGDGIRSYYFEGLLLYFVISLASICIVSAWLIPAYFMAPKFKEKTSWVFYFTGCLITILLVYFIYNEGGSLDEKIAAIVFFLTSIFYGFILNLRLQNKWSLQEFIDNEIKTTHL